jgi:hypothetical protein
MAASRRLSCARYATASEPTLRFLARTAGSAQRVSRDLLYTSSRPIARASSTPDFFQPDCNQDLSNEYHRSLEGVLLFLSVGAGVSKLEPEVLFWQIDSKALLHFFSADRLKGSRG